MEEKVPHMVEQVIKYSDGTETVIKYRGVIENGVLIPDSPEEDSDVEKPVRVSAKSVKKESLLKRVKRAIKR